MTFIQHLDSPLGTILLAADDVGLTGLWFEGQKYFAATLPAAHEEKQLPVFDQTQRWLDCYFSGKNPGFTPPLGPKVALPAGRMGNITTNTVRGNNHL